MDDSWRIAKVSAPTAVDGMFEVLLCNSAGLERLYRFHTEVEMLGDVIISMIDASEFQRDAAWTNLIRPVCETIHRYHRARHDPGWRNLERRTVLPLHRPASRRARLRHWLASLIWPHSQASRRFWR